LQNELKVTVFLSQLLDSLDWWPLRELGLKCLNLVSELQKEEAESATK
jgi:hypothetical protein